MKYKIRRTKIVTTLGPSTDKKGILKKIIQSGSHILRLNFSHGNPEDHLNRAKKARMIAEELNIFIALLGDLQGPKIRISGFKNKKIFLNYGDKFVLNSNLLKNQGTEKEVGISYLNLSNEVVSGDILLLDDGKIQLKVIQVNNKKIITKVKVGGYLTDNKGLNKLGGGLSASALTKKDKNDIQLASQIQVDYLAVSFPRTASDLEKARFLLKKSGSNAKIIAKIERAEAVFSKENMKNIILSSDGIMIARGDLGVEIGDDKLIGIQKYLIKKAKNFNKITITATQMMESMINNPFPTRAEVMDVANAVLDGTDAVMLSAETASGKFPIETILSMSKICSGAEKVPSANISNHRLNTLFSSVSESIAMAAMYIANHFKKIHAIIVISDTNKVALLASRITSGISIFYLSSNIKKLNISSLYRGVIPIYFKTSLIGIDAFNKAIFLLKEKKYIQLKNKVIILQSDPLNIDCNINNFRIITVI